MERALAIKTLGGSDGERVGELDPHGTRFGHGSADRGAGERGRGEAGVRRRAEAQRYRPGGGRHWRRSRRGARERSLGTAPAWTNAV